MIYCSSTYSPCWPEEASSGAVCLHHSSPREVALLSLGDGQERRTNTNAYVCWSDVSPGKRCVGPESTTAQYVVYGETTVPPYLCIFYLSPVLVTLNSTSSFTPKRVIMPGHDTR